MDACLRAGFGGAACRAVLSGGWGRGYGGRHGQAMASNPPAHSLASPALLAVPHRQPSTGSATARLQSTATTKASACTSARAARSTRSTRWAVALVTKGWRRVPRRLRGQPGATWPGGWHEARAVGRSDADSNGPPHPSPQPAGLPGPCSPHAGVRGQVSPSRRFAWAGSASANQLVQPVSFERARLL
jgi:hypothetical protein